MSLESQTKERQTQIFKNALKFQESAAGVVIQRIPGSYLYRILKPLIQAREHAMVVGEDPNRIDPLSHCPDTDDHLVNTIYNMDHIFAHCKTKNVDMLASAEAVAMEWKEDGAPGHACLMLAWKTTFNTDTRRFNEADLVGAMTLHKFKVSDNFSTDRSSLGDRDYQILHGHAASGSNETRNYFQRNTMYIDGLCAKGKGGVGKLLVLHAIRWAVMRKCTGIIALSYSRRQLGNGKHPESYPIFQSLGFEKTIPTANFRVQIYGTWFFQSLTSINFAGIIEDAVSICTRTGFTDKTSDKLIWRCPN